MDKEEELEHEEQETTEELREEGISEMIIKLKNNKRPRENGVVAESRKYAGELRHDLYKLIGAI